MNSGSKTFTVRNCTVYGNTAVGYDGAKEWGAYGVGGIGVLSGTANVENTIFAANESPCQSWTTGGYPEWRVIGGTLKFTNCLMPTDVTWPASATACLNGAPSFMNVEAGNFRLRRGSLGIDAGNTGLVQEALDLARKPRIAPSRPGIVDIGCYENQQQGLVIFVR